MKIAVLFDGAGLARLGLEKSGHECTGFELDPWKHHLSRLVGSGNCILADVCELNDCDFKRFDAVWASPPCQQRSEARTQGAPTSKYATDFLDWCLGFPPIISPVLWVENIMTQSAIKNTWGKPWNAAQFLRNPIQCRNRMIGGRYKDPQIFRPYKRAYAGVCPCITASEYKGCASDTRRASRFYGRRITLTEAAYHQGFEIPAMWRNIPPDFNGRPSDWTRNLYEAIGNGVPVYMAQAFGEAML